MGRTPCCAWAVATWGSVPARTRPQPRFCTLSSSSETRMEATSSRGFFCKSCQVEVNRFGKCVCVPHCICFYKPSRWEVHSFGVGKSLFVCRLRCVLNRTCMQRPKRSTQHGEGVPCPRSWHGTPNVPLPPQEAGGGCSRGPHGRGLPTTNPRPEPGMVEHMLSSPPPPLTPFCWGLGGRCLLRLTLVYAGSRTTQHGPSRSHSH